MTYVPPAIKNACDARVSSFDERGVNSVLRQLAYSAGQPLRAVTTWGGQVGPTRRANIEFRDSLERTVTGCFAALIWIAEEAGSEPGSSQITSVVTGRLLFELDSGFIFLVESDERGQIAIDIEGATGYRWIGVVPLGGVYGSGATWA